MRTTTVVPPGWTLGEFRFAYHEAHKFLTHTRVETDAGTMTTCECGARWTVPPLDDDDLVVTVKMKLWQWRLLRKVFLPANPNKLRGKHPDVVAAAKAFIAAIERAGG